MMKKELIKFIKRKWSNQENWSNLGVVRTILKKADCMFIGPSAGKSIIDDGCAPLLIGYSVGKNITGSMNISIDKPPLNEPN